MDMSKPDARVVAWEVRHFYDEKWGGWYGTSHNYHLLYGAANNIETRVLVPESLLAESESRITLLQDSIAAMLAERNAIQARLDGVVAAITKHRDTFPDEALPSEFELWASIAALGGESPGNEEVG